VLVMKNLLKQIAKQTLLQLTDNQLFVKNEC